MAMPTVTGCHRHNQRRRILLTLVALIATLLFATVAGQPASTAEDEDGTKDEDGKKGDKKKYEKIYDSTGALASECDLYQNKMCTTAGFKCCRRREWPKIKRLDENGNEIGDAKSGITGLLTTKLTTALFGEDVDIVNAVTRPPKPGVSTAAPQTFVCEEPTGHCLEVQNRNIVCAGNHDCTPSRPWCYFDNYEQGVSRGGDFKDRAKSGDGSVQGILDRFGISDGVVDGVEGNTITGRATLATCHQEPKSTSVTVVRLWQPPPAPKTETRPLDPTTFEGNFYKTTTSTMTHDGQPLDVDVDILWRVQADFVSVRMTCTQCLRMVSNTSETSVWLGIGFGPPHGRGDSAGGGGMSTLMFSRNAMTGYGLKDGVIHYYNGYSTTPGAPVLARAPHAGLRRLYAAALDADLSHQSFTVEFDRMLTAPAEDAQVMDSHDLVDDGEPTTVSWAIGVGNAETPWSRKLEDGSDQRLKAEPPQHRVHGSFRANLFTDRILGQPCKAATHIVCGVQGEENGVDSEDVYCLGTECQPDECCRVPKAVVTFVTNVKNCTVDCVHGECSASANFEVCECDDDWIGDACQLPTAAVNPVIALLATAISVSVVFCIYRYARKAHYDEVAPASSCNRDCSNVCTCMLTFADVGTDVLFAAYMYSLGDEYVMFFRATVLSLAVCVCVNLVVLLRVVNKLRDRPEFMRHMHSNMKVSSTLLFAACFNAEIFSFIGNRLCGLDAFAAPLTRADTLQLKSMGLITNLLEDLPQLVIQVLVAEQMGSDQRQLTVLVSLGLTSIMLLRGVSKHALQMVLANGNVADGDNHRMRQGLKRDSVALSEIGVTTTKKSTGADTAADGHDTSSEEDDDDDIGDDFHGSGGSKQRMQRSPSSYMSADDVNKMEAMQRQQLAGTSVSVVSSVVGSCGNKTATVITFDDTDANVATAASFPSEEGVMTVVMDDV